MKRNLTTTEHSMLMTSIEYITNHPHITTESIPSDLLKFWSVPNFTDRPRYEDGSLQVLIFMFVLRRYYWKGKQVSTFLNTVRFNQLFFSFQIVIAAALHCRECKQKAEPFPVFHLHEYRTPDLHDPEVLLCSYETITGCRISEKRGNGGAVML